MTQVDPPQPSTRQVLSTQLAVTTYAQLGDFLEARARAPGAFAVDFSNTHIVTMRRVDLEFSRITASVDLFVPDGMPLVWCLNAQGAALKDRVYGPAFMERYCADARRATRHFLLGGNDDCLAELIRRLTERNTGIDIAGSQNGYFPPAEEQNIVERILDAKPDFVWIGLGTPKQQEWIAKWKHRFPRGVLLAVGFAFDVNAGTKPDAPPWMQRTGLTWLFRVVSEPKRLAWRYFRYNSLFLWHLLTDGILSRPPGES